MSAQSIRFLQSGGFRLHQPMAGLADVSDGLRPLLVEAPLASAANVTAVAIREEVDFVVLTGDVLNPVEAGPAAIAFLRDQFTRLEERGIPVYWAPSQLDTTGAWIRRVEWPANVHLFSDERTELLVHHRADLPLAEVVGRGWHPAHMISPSDFSTGRKQAFRIAVVPAWFDVSSSTSTADYWALGGSVSASTPREGSPYVHCAGSTFGSDPTETGIHGCTVVDVDARGATRTRMVATDSIRWCHERVPLSLAVSRQSARQAFQARVKHLVAEIAKPMLVVWTITGDHRFDTRFVQRDDREVLLAWLREEFADASPPIWSVSLELEPPDMLPPEWCEEDSILGDYLRVVSKHEARPDSDLELTKDLEVKPPTELAAVASRITGVARRELLRSAALLGADLLRGEESPDR